MYSRLDEGFFKLSKGVFKLSKGFTLYRVTLYRVTLYRVKPLESLKTPLESLKKPSSRREYIQTATPELRPGNSGPLWGNVGRVQNPVKEPFKGLLYRVLNPSYIAPKGTRISRSQLGSCGLDVLPPR